MQMIYLTYGEPPSGVYSGQVCDVVNHLNSEHGAIRLVAFISIKQFSINKRKIKKECNNAIVFPMFPKATYWRMNRIWLFFICLFLMPDTIIARNVIAANMALSIKKITSVKKVCFDGRGAIAAEWKEYDVLVPHSWKKEIDLLEKKAIVQSDFRIAVSHQLVDFWRSVYNYGSVNHVVIPCTISTSFITTPSDESDILNTRKSMGFNADDVIFVYSGSTAGWQSFHLLLKFLSAVLNNPSNKVLFLSKDDSNISSLSQQFPQQVKQAWLQHEQVKQVLSACDLGILIREETITNRVASPTKFAEYLAAGLPVIISPSLGDYTDFVARNNCGYIIDDSTILNAFHKTEKTEKNRLIQLVAANFTKEACNGSYQHLVSFLKQQ